jgi:hypothetical protein
MFHRNGRGYAARLFGTKLRRRRIAQYGASKLQMLSGAWGGNFFISEEFATLQGKLCYILCEKNIGDDEEARTQEGW